jgi:hypothetical protein
MRIVLLLCCVMAMSAADAASCSATSGASRDSLLELYTSEGCSSCPPADRWLSHLPDDAGVVPLAFHVDYWDRLGWHDPFAQAAFSQRQRARNRGTGWVYTPQVMLDGKDFRAWHRGLPDRSTAPASAQLTLTLIQTAGGLEVQAESRFADPAAERDATLYLALTENRLSSSVEAGENARHILHHDHVVRQLAGPLDPHHARHTFTLQPGWKAANLGVTAFVLDAHGTTLQALAQIACL